MSRRLPILYSALLLTGVNLLLRLAGTGFQVFLSRRIGASGIGLMQLVMSVGGMAMVAGMGGIRTATMYLVAGELGTGRTRNVTWVLSGCLLYSICFSGGTALALHHFAPWIARVWLQDIRTAAAIRLYAAFLPVTCLCGVMTGCFTAANRIGTLAAVEVAEQLCAMSLTLILLSGASADVPATACQYVVLGSGCGAVFTLICLAVLWSRQKLPAGDCVPVQGRLLRTALPLALADDVKTGITTLENLMVPGRLALHRETAEPLASFGLVTGMVFPVMMFPAAILFGLTELLIPELARCNAAKQTGRIRHLVRRGLHTALLYGITLAGALYLLAGPLCDVLYDSREAAAQLRRYALLIPMLYCDILTDAMTKGLGQQHICVRYNIISSVLDVMLLYLLLPRTGMDGYFVSFLVTHVINFLLSLGRLLKITGQQIPPLIPVNALLSGTFALLTASLLPEGLLAAAAFGVIFLCLMYLTGSLPREDLRWLLGLARKKDLTQP